MFKLIPPKELEVLCEYDFANISQFERSKLEYAVLLLGEKYFGNPWYIRLGEKKYRFRVENINSIWEELPSLLKHVTSAQPAFFYFVEQGSDALLIAEPGSNPARVLVSVVPGFLSSGRWHGEHHIDKMPELERVPVKVQQFVEEWKTFINEIIKILVQEQFIQRSDPSINEYVDSLPSTSKNS